jgi:8-oxo-dGTP diphosphatase
MGHIHEKIDFTVVPIIIHPDKQKALLVKHPKYGRWMSIGGHIELDETPDQALLREIKEECGLDVEVLSEKPTLDTTDNQVILWRPRFVDIHDANPPHRHIGLVYFCLAKSADFTLSDEHEEMRWFTKEQMDAIKDTLSPIAHYYALCALKELAA